MLVDRIGQVITTDSTILYLGDKQVYEVDGLSARKVRVRTDKIRRASSFWPENCLVIDENLWVMARQQVMPQAMQQYWQRRLELIK